MTKDFQDELAKLIAYYRLKMPLEEMISDLELAKMALEEDEDNGEDEE